MFMIHCSEGKYGHRSRVFPGGRLYVGRAWAMRRQVLELAGAAHGKADRTRQRRDGRRFHGFHRVRGHTAFRIASSRSCCRSRCTRTSLLIVASIAGQLIGKRPMKWFEREGRRGRATNRPSKRVGGRTGFAFSRDRQPLGQKQHGDHHK